jgi:putative ABC transport system permease protein
MSSKEIEDTQLTLEEMSEISSHRSFYYEKAKIDTTTQGYGVTGLLSLDFIISLIAAIITAFAFSAILMEKRKHEFAILRAIGAKKKHIYKLALGENGLMMLTASLWGIFLGTGIAYLFNGVFIFVSMMTGGAGSFERLVMVPTIELIVICTITFIGMLGAALMSIRSSANQDLALGVKEV